MSKLTKFNKTKKSGSQGAEILKTMTKNGITDGKIWAHNTLIAFIYIMVMLLVAIMALELAYAGVALSIGYSGAYGLTSVADMLTMYTTLIMVCGIVLFFVFKIESALIRAMSKRFWHKNKTTGDIDKGEIYAKKHNTDVKENVNLKVVNK